MIKKISTMLPAVIVLVALITSATLSAKPKYSLKPDLPGLFYASRNAIEYFRNSGLPEVIDLISGATPLFNLIFTAGTPVTTIIPGTGEMRSAERRELRLTALTANLLLFPAPFFLDQQAKIDEFARLVRSLNPDVLFLQEVWDNESLQYLVKRFADYHAVLMPSPLFNHSGLLIFTRFMPESTSAAVFPLSMQHNPEELIARKGLLMAKIRFADTNIWLIDTHLYSAGLGAQFKASFSQFNLMAKQINALAEPVVIGGDMNMLPQELEPLLVDGIVRDDCNLPTAGGKRRSKKLDYVLSRGSERYAVQVLGSRAEWPVFFSDHSPVFAEIRFSTQH